MVQSRESLILSLYKKQKHQTYINDVAVVPFSMEIIYPWTVEGIESLDRISCFYNIEDIYDEKINGLKIYKNNEPITVYSKIKEYIDRLNCTSSEYKIDTYTQLMMDIMEDPSLSKEQKLGLLL